MPNDHPESFGLLPNQSAIHHEIIVKDEPHENETGEIEDTDRNETNDECRLSNYALVKQEVTLQSSVDEDIEEEDYNTIRFENGVIINSSGKDEEWSDNDDLFDRCPIEPKIELPIKLEKDSNSFENKNLLETSTTRADSHNSMQCFFCDFSASDITEILSHKLEKHPDVPETLCYICGQKFNHLQMLSNHIISSHTPKNCNMCSFRTTKTGILSSHIQTAHTQKKIHECGECNENFTTLKKLQTHVNRKHKVKSFECRHCEYQTQRPDHFKSHVNSVHTKEVIHKCEVCEYSSTRKDQLGRHMSNIHIRQAFYYCEHCQYKSSSNWNVREHISMVHYKLLIFNCQYCDYKASRSQHLKVHINSKHVRNLLYQCQYCSYKATRTHHLKGHLKNKHNVN